MSQNMEDKSDLKRKRSENWPEPDKVLLKELVKDRVKEIEDKNTDTNTNQRKKKAWAELEEKFNNMCQGRQRTVAQLKSQWTVIKMQAKKDVADFRREARKTGGGPPPQELQSSANDIVVWLPNEFVVDTNEFDSDYAKIVKNIEEEGRINVLDEQDKVDQFELENSPQPEIVNPQRKKHGKRKNKPELNKADEKISRIVEVDVHCRTELHEIQMENERKKGRNLDLEHDLIRAKIEYFQNKTVIGTTN